MTSLELRATALSETAQAAVLHGRRALDGLLMTRDPKAPAMREVRDLTIPGPGGEMRARLYVPANAYEDPGPGLVYFHGGGFAFCDIDTHDSMCRWLAGASAVRVLSIDYRRAPEHVFPAQIEDAFAATDWARDHMAELGFDGERFAIGGDSAGGYLAASVANVLNCAGEERPIALQLLIYPLLHLEPDIWAGGRFGEWRLMGRYAVRDIRRRMVAPVPNLLGAAPPCAPPAIVTWGEMDPVKADARTYAAELAALGVPVTARRYARLPHGYGNFTTVLAGARKAMEDTGELLGKGLGAL